MGGRDWKVAFDEPGFEARELVSASAREVELMFDDTRPSGNVLSALLDGIESRLGREGTVVEYLPRGREFFAARAYGWELLKILAQNSDLPPGFTLNWRRLNPPFNGADAEASAVLSSGDVDVRQSLQIHTTGRNPAVEPVELAHDVVDGLAQISTEAPVK